LGVCVNDCVRLLPVGGLDLLDQGVDFFGLEFIGVLGHVAFAVGDDCFQVVQGHGAGFVGDEGRSSEMAAFAGFAVTLGAILLEDRVGGEGRVRRSLGEGCDRREK